MLLGGINDTPALADTLARLAPALRGLEALERTTLTRGAWVDVRCDWLAGCDGGSSIVRERKRSPAGTISASASSPVALIVGLSASDSLPARC